MISNEQRAHDLAIAMLTTFEFSKLESFPSKSEFFDFTKDYENAYKHFLNSFEEDF